MDEERLIEAVKQKPALYDKNDKRYSHRDVVQRLWEQVANETNESVDIVKKKRAFLRDYFRRQKKIMSTCKSGQATEKKTKWPFFDSMSFLDRYLEPAQTVTNVIIETTEETVSDFDISQAAPSQREEVKSVESRVPGPSQNPGTSAESAYMPTDSAQPKLRVAQKRKRETDFDMKILQALKEPEEDEHGHLHFWKGLQPMLKELEPLEAKKFKYEVHGLLIRFLERAKQKKLCQQSGAQQSLTYPMTCYQSALPNYETTQNHPSTSPSNSSIQAEYEHYSQNVSRCEDRFTPY